MNKTIQDMLTDCLLRCEPIAIGKYTIVVHFNGCTLYREGYRCITLMLKGYEEGLHFAPDSTISRKLLKYILEVSGRTYTKLELRYIGMHGATIGIPFYFLPKGLES